MKTIEFTGFNGVRNDLSPERFKKEDLSVGSNIDIDNSGKVWRRQGTTKRAAGNMHSLYHKGSMTLVVDAGNLTLIDSAFGKKTLLPVAGRKLSYTEVNESVFWSDEFQSGIVKQGENRRWGVAVPPQPGVVINPSGNLPAGTYLLTTTYVRRDGKESGAPASVSVTLGDNQGLAITLVPSSDPLVYQQNLYMSNPNGEACFLAGGAVNSLQTLTLSDIPQLGPMVRTQFMGPAPAGAVVGYAFGRAYVASGAYLWYSLPYEYELFDLRTGFIGFDTTVTTFAPVSDGIFVGSTRAVHWLGGTDPTAFERKQVASFGAVRGTEQEIPAHYLGHDDETPQGVVQTFMTQRGMCAGLEHGVLKNLTGGRYFPVAASAGASLLKVRGGTPLLTTTLFKEQ